MKNILLILLFLSPTLLLAQADQTTGTSLDEYRFLSKGYAYQLQMGIDPFKEGYDLKTIASSKKEVKYIGLYESNTSTPKGILLIFKSGSEEPTYICLPNNQANQRVWELYEMDRKAIVDPNIWESYDAAMRDLAFQLMGSAPASLEPSQVEAPPTEYAAIDKEPAPEVKKKEEIKEEAEPDKLVVKGVNSKVEKQDTKEVSTEEINPDVNITMDSDIVNNGVVKAPVVRGLYSGRGILVIKFCFDQNGDVIEARYTMGGSTTYKENLKQMALESVRKAKFAPSSKSEQCGKATFHFK